MALSASNTVLAIGLTCAAGFATLLGFLVALIPKMNDARLLAGCLALSAGVMVMVSFVEILPEATELFTEAGYTENHAFMINVATFFCGCLLCLSLDMIAQFIVNRRQRSAKELEHYNSEDTQSSALLGTGLMAAIALTLHNLPEGIVTFLGTLEDADVGISLALAIGVHNIPEGVAVAMPILKATGSKTKAFLWTLLASVAQPIGGILAWLALANMLTPASIAVMMSVTAGIMVYVGVVKLQKEAISRDPSDTWSGYGFILGMAVMALSLVLFKIR